MSDRAVAAPPRLGRRVLLLAVFSTLTLAAAATFTVEQRSAPTAPARVRALRAPLFTPRRVPGALSGLLSRARLDHELAASNLDPADVQVCVDVRVVGSADEVWSVNGDRAEIPASTMKLLTGGAALELLDPGFRFTTQAQAGAPVAGGRLLGPLYLVGGGDPLLSTPAYAQWEESRRPATVPAPPRTDLTKLAKSVREAGISHIEGPIIGDSTFFDAQTINPAWKQSYFDEKVIAPITGLEVNRNLDNWQADRTGPLGFVTDPPATAAEALRQLLVAEGVTVDGPATSGAAPPGMATVATLPSVPLADVVAQLERASDNFIAENLLKTIGKVAGGEGSFAAGVHAVVDVLTRRGVAVKGLVMADGSGLARTDKVPCTLLADLLARTPSSPGLSRLPELLAVSGVNGTLLERLPQPELKGKIRGKTGGLEGVANLAGIVSGSDGSARLAFAVLVNGGDDAVAAAAPDIQGRLATALSRYPAVIVVPAGV